MDNAEIETKEVEVLVNEISDRVLENAASSKSGFALSYTLASCTGFSVCPTQ